MSTPPDDIHHYRGDRHCMEDSVGLLMKQAFRSLQQAIDRELAPLDLTAMQWRSIILLAQRRADTPAELSRLVEVDTGAMTRMLDRLEAKNLLRRTRSDEDRRVVRLELTAEGERVAAEIPYGLAAVLNRHLRGFSTGEVAQLKHFLNRMIANGGPSS